MIKTLNAIHEHGKSTVNITTNVNLNYFSQKVQCVYTAINIQLVYNITRNL